MALAEEHAFFAKRLSHAALAMARKLPTEVKAIANSHRGREAALARMSGPASAVG